MSRLELLCDGFDIESICVNSAPSSDLNITGCHFKRLNKNVYSSTPVSSLLLAKLPFPHEKCICRCMSLDSQISPFGLLWGQMHAAREVADRVISLEVCVEKVAQWASVLCQPHLQQWQLCLWIKAMPLIALKQGQLWQPFNQYLQLCETLQCLIKIMLHTHGLLKCVRLLSVMAGLKHLDTGNAVSSNIQQCLGMQNVLAPLHLSVKSTNCLITVMVAIGYCIYQLILDN